jgi:hypothetical protein
MSEPKAWSGPGAILSFFKLREPAKISPKTLEDWFDQEFVPALLATGAVSAAWQYQAANEGYDKQQVILYKVPDLALIQAGKFQSVPRTSKQSLFEGPVDDYIEVDTRVYSFAQLYETSRRDAGKPNLLCATRYTMSADGLKCRGCADNDASHDAARARWRGRFGGLV